MDNVVNKWKIQTGEKVKKAGEEGMIADKRYTRERSAERTLRKNK